MIKNNQQNIRSNIAIYGLIPLIFVFLGRIHELVPALENLSLGKLTVGFAIALYFISPRENNKVGLFSLFQIKCIVGIVFMALLSIPFSAWPGQSYDFFFSGYLKTLVFLGIFLKITNTVPDLNKACWGLSSAIGALSLASLQIQSSGRISVSHTYDPNDLAFVVVVSLPIIYYMMKNEGGIKKIILLAILGMAIVTIIRTMSRGGFLGLMIVTTVALIKEGNKDFAKKVVAVTAMFGILLFFSTEAFWNRMTTMTTLGEDYNLTQSAGRIAIWKRGMQLMLENPVLGVGLGAFEAGSGNKFGNVTGAWLTAHNSFLQIGAELGVVGLILFIALILSSLSTLRRLKSTFTKFPELENILRLTHGIEIAFYGYIVTGFFLSQAYSTMLYFLVGLVVILKKIELIYAEHQRYL